MKDIFFTVSIVTMNRETELKRALQSVYKQTYKNFEVIVVDNNSTDNTVNMIEKEFPDVKLIKLNKNIGCPPARNVSAKYAKGDLIFFLDDDGWIEENVLEEIKKVYKNSDDDVALFATNSIEYDPKDNQYIQFIQSSELYDIYDFRGGSVAIDLKKFKEVGLFPELHYGAEEAFISMRFFLKNYKMKMLPYIFMHHKPSASRNIDLIFYNKVKNELIWNYYFAPFFLLPLLFLWKSFNYTKLATSKGAFKYSLLGIRDFFLNIAILERNPLPFNIFWDFLKKRKNYIKKYQINKTVFRSKKK